MTDDAGPGAIAYALIEARRGAVALAAFPGPPLQSLADAYAVQRKVLKGVGGKVLGWKVGRIPAALVGPLAAERLAGPILSVEDAADPEARVFPGGAGAVEAEFMLRLARIPARLPDSNQEVSALIDEVRAGIEIASSPVRSIHDDAPFGIIADLGINNGNLLGPRFERDGDFAGLQVTTAIDGRVVGQGRACNVLDGPFGSVLFVLKLHFEGMIELAAGQWISAGAITGVHSIEPGQVAEFDFGGRAQMRCIAVAQRPTRCLA